MKALLLCASHNDLGLIRALRKLDFYIICTGKLENAPGQKYIDEYIKADYSDKELILSIARENNIDVICQCCNDFGVYTAAYVAEKLNLPGYDSYDTILTLHNKDRFKKFTQKYNISSPISVSFDSKKKANKWMSNYGKYPMIIKPIDASAGNGIQKVSGYEESINAIEKAFEISREKRIVIEPFIKGKQYGFCTFLINQKVVAFCTNNEYSIVNPYRVEIDTYPADNYHKVSDFLIKQVEKIASILKLKDGIFHLQYIMDGEQPMIIEVMRRVLGNMYSVPANMLTGIDWDYWETRAKCGLSCKDFPNNVKQEGYFAYKTILANKDGIISKITISPEYEKYIVQKYMLCKVGDVITDYNKKPIGFLFMMFPNMDKMKSILIDNYDNKLVDIQ